MIISFRIFRSFVIHSIPRRLPFPVEEHKAVQIYICIYRLADMFHNNVSNNRLTNDERKSSIRHFH